MREWLESVAGPAYATALMWTILALIGLFVLLLLIRVVRSLTGGTFVAGGRNRKARLAVMDAAAVDSQRRLVLVRRDDVEHLILIGGPSDVVVEQNIRLVAAGRRPGAEDLRQEPHPPLATPVRPPPAVVPPQPAAAPPPAAAQPPQRRPEAPPPQPRPQPMAAPQQQPSAAPHPQPAAAPTPPQPRPAPAAPVMTAAAPAAVVPHAPVPPVSIEEMPPRRMEPAPPPRPAEPPLAQPVYQRQQAVASAPPPVAPPQRPGPAAPSQDIVNEIDEAMLNELQAQLEAGDRAAQQRSSEDEALDAEMSRLLGELSHGRR